MWVDNIYFKLRVGMRIILGDFNNLVILIISWCFILVILLKV